MVSVEPISALEVADAVQYGLSAGSPCASRPEWAFALTMQLPTHSPPASRRARPDKEAGQRTGRHLVIGNQTGLEDSGDT